DIFAVISLRTSQSKEPFFEDGVSPIPKRQCKAKPAFPIRDAQQAVLTPAISPAARVVVSEIIPALPIGRVILPHRGPLTFCQIRPPPFPIFCARAVFCQPLFFCIHRSPTPNRQ